MRRSEMEKEERQSLNHRINNFKYCVPLLHTFFQSFFPFFLFFFIIILMSFNKASEDVIQFVKTDSNLVYMNTTTSNDNNKGSI